MKTSLLIASAITATAALPLIARAGPAPEPSFQAEKCYGINVAGRNDCAASNSHSPSPEIAEFPLRLQSACASHLVT